MSSEVGQAYISILPSAKGFASKLQREVGTDLARAGKASGKDFGKQLEAAAVAQVGGTGTKLKTELTPDLGRAGKDAGQEFGQEFAKAAEDTGGDSSVSEGIGSKLKLGLATAGAAAGVALMAGIGTAMEREALTDKLGVQLGGTPRQAKRYGKVAGDLYAGAWGESMADVSDAVSSVASSIGGMRNATAPDLTNMTAKALDFATAFEVDVARAAQVAGQMVRTGLVRDADEAMDLLFASMQRVPANVREDLLDAMDEYGPFMQDLGIVGEDAMSLLVEGAEKGMYGIDKAGDAVKEFSIRATDMSTATKTAYNELGINARDATNDILAGGDQASGAFDEIVRKLLNIEDPATRANTAIALFGTPLEDLSVTEIPAFLRSLTQTDNKLGKTAGAAERAGKRLNDNASVKFTQFKRTLETGFVNFIGNKLIPAAEDLWEEIGPDVRKFGKAISNMGEDLGPVAKDVLPVFASALGAVANAVGRFASAFSKLPGSVQAALISGGLFALLRGRRGRGTGGGGLGLGGGLPLILPGVGGPRDRGRPRVPDLDRDTPRPSRTTRLTSRLRPGRPRVADLATGAGLASLFFDPQATPGEAALSGGLTGLVTGGPWGALAGTVAGGATSEFASIGTPEPAQRNVQSILDTLMGSDVGKYAEDLDINVEKLATGIARYGTSSKVFKDTITKLKGVDQNVGSELAEFLTPGWQSKQTKAERAMDDLTASTKGFGRTAQTAKTRTDAVADSGGDLAGLFRSALIPGAQDLADKYDLTGRQARHLREAMLDATKGGRSNETQLRELADQLGLTTDQTRDLLRQTGVLSGQQRDDARSTRAHNTALRTLADGLGLGRDKADTLADALLREEAENRDAGRASKLHKGELRELADQLGLTRDQTQRLIEKYRDVPPKVETDAKFNHGQAERDVNAFTRFFNTALGNLDDEEVGVKLSASARSAIKGVQGIVGNLPFLAGGGPITGGIKGKDSVLAALMPGEHVFTDEEVRQAGGHGAMYAIRKMIRNGEFAKRGDLQYFRTGGAVELNTPIRERGTGSAVDDVDRLFAAIGRAVGTEFSDRFNDYVTTNLATGGGRPLGPGGTLSPAQVAVGQSFAKRQAGMPYQWGGTGNPSWDCSGLVGGTWAAALGRNPYVRQFTTASFGSGGAYGFRPGGGIFTVGNDPGSHMASNMGGLGVESRGGDGVVLGSGITPLSSFQYMAHYDNGGKLRPGWTLAHNGTGRDETVVSPQDHHPRRSSRPLRFELDVGGGRVLTGVIRDEIDGHEDFSATTGRMR